MPVFRVRNPNGPGDTEAIVPVVYTTKVTTVASTGLGTVNFPQGLFAAAPSVQVSVESTSSTQAVQANITSVTSASATVRTFITQTSNIVVGGTIAPVVLTSAVVHVWATPLS